MLLVHSEQRPARQLCKPCAQQGNERRRKKESAEIYKKRSCFARCRRFHMNSLLPNSFTNHSAISGTGVPNGGTSVSRSSSKAFSCPLRSEMILSAAGFPNL